MSLQVRRCIEVALCTVALTACGGAAAERPRAETARPQRVLAQATLKGADAARCDSTVKGREFSEYDTSGDDVPDVRKVFVRAGDATASRLILICREADVNHDGLIDVIRIYDDDGRPTREDSDRNFDGTVDQVTLYQSGEVVQHEFDNNFDGRVDTKVFYSKGQPVRAERDLTGRSTDTHWLPDRWEYFEGGKLVRMGTDLDGDSRVDRWDRDADWKRAQDAAKAQTAAASTAD
jgi:hypothetical protein